MGILNLLIGIAGLVLVIWAVSLAVNSAIIAAIIVGLVGVVLLAWATGQLRV